ncbi:MAG: alpha/beta hydrolase [Bacteroidetes bacterium]|nr:MAG: alpha/beta hydrolase [Bacteroidota bacterium]
MKIYLEGEGEQIVLFIHGFLEDRSMWNFITPDEFRMVIIEIPGHGEEPLFVYRSIEELAHEIKDTLNREGVIPNAIVGHSMGGYIAIELFKMIDQSDKLVLLNSNFWSDSYLKKEDRRRVAEIVYNQKKLFLETAIPNLFGDKAAFLTEIEQLIMAAEKMSPDAIAIASIAMSNRNDNTDYLRNESREIMIIQGKNDNIVPIDQMMEATKGWNHPMVVDSGHMSHTECRERIIELLNDAIMH